MIYQTRSLAIKLLYLFQSFDLYFINSWTLNKDFFNLLLTNKWQN